MPNITPLTPNTGSEQPPAGFTPRAAAAPAPNVAADLIRSKLDLIYAGEPDAAVELQESEASPRRSAHQEYIHQLSTSGKGLAAIQTEWHDYYVKLDDKEKHQVWQEFYSHSSLLATTKQQPAASLESAVTPAIISAQAVADHKHAAHATPKYKRVKALRAARPKRDLRSVQAIRATIRDQVTAGGKLNAKHHVQSLLFGLGVGALAIFVFLFGFFNEVVIAPFIQPSRAAAATPIIIGPSGVAPTAEPQVIIPKINVQIPAIYDLTDNSEATVQTALESGIAHYPTTPLPGEQGNAAFFGHSSNNIFNKGKYKFAFVLLHLMKEGDTFYLSYGGKMYVYKVISTKIVSPSQVEVLDAVPGKTSTATLITCDPPGTSINRLVVIGEQISPDPSGNTIAAEPVEQTLQSSAVSLPGNAPTLGGRLLSSAIGKTLVIIFIVGAIAFTLRWVNKPLTQS